jgi:hypothetical protein
MKKRKAFKAWLVTWEWFGNHAKPKDKIVEILDPRITPERVRQIVELLYHRDASLREKIAWRLSKRTQIYPAEFQTMEGVRWTGEIICGHNPWLRARLVDNLIIETDAESKETASWDDRHPLREVRKILRRISSR